MILMLATLIGVTLGAYLYAVMHRPARRCRACSGGQHSTCRANEAPSSINRYMVCGCFDTAHI